VHVCREVFQRGKSAKKVMLKVEGGIKGIERCEECEGSFEARRIMRRMRRVIEG
jgi:hypothetical protein